MRIAILIHNQVEKHLLTWLSQKKGRFSNTKFNHKIIKLKGPHHDLSLTPLQEYKLESTKRLS